MTKSVAILGCGPAGMMVAHAANLCGWDFHIYSNRQKSPLHGAQYLHESIPSITCGEGEMLRYELIGTPEQYRHKVYGDAWDGQTSPEDFETEHLAWNLRTAYDDLWDMYGEQIGEATINQHSLKTLRRHWEEYDLVISTIPRTVFDHDESNFQQARIWALGDGDYERVHIYRPKPFHVVCNGLKGNAPWYRVSNIFGYCTMEWTQWWNAPYASVTPPARGAALVVKPLVYTGNAATDIIHLGRYAEWTKGVLTSDVFRESMRIFASDSVEVSNGR